MQTQTQVKRQPLEQGLPKVIPLPPPPPPKKDINTFLCPLHHQHYRYKCLNPACTCLSPFACGQLSCLDQHFHENETLSVVRFNGEAYKSAFRKVESAKDRIEQHYSKAMVIKSQLDAVRNGLSELMGDFKQVNSLCQTVNKQLDRTLSKTFLGSLESVVDVQLKIKQSIEELRNKLVIPSSEDKDREGQIDRQIEDTRSTKGGETSFQLPSIKGGKEAVLPEPRITLDSQDLRTFLEANIPTYKESNLQILQDGTLEHTPLEELHRKLAGKSNLVFLISGESLTDHQHTLLGCYFTAKYPQLHQPVVQDCYSFVFFKDKTIAKGFAKFLANSSSEKHLQISGETLQVGGGLLLRGLDNSVDYSFPTAAYVGEKKHQNMVANTLKIDRLQVVSVDPELD